MYIDPQALVDDGAAFRDLSWDLRGIGNPPDQRFSDSLPAEVEAQVKRAVGSLRGPEFAGFRNALELVLKSVAGPAGLLSSSSELYSLGASLTGVANDYIITEKGIYADFNDDGKPDPGPNGAPATPIDRERK